MYMKLEVVVLPVSDVDRAKVFYQSLGWREDADFAVDDGYRIVQFTPPESEASIIFGTGLTTAPRPDAQRLIARMNACEIPILAIDLPSGLDCDTGDAPGACIRATRTVTFVAEKSGFANPDSRPFTGEVTVADIGCPREVIDEVLGVR